jgi:hypothetical protein
LTVFINGKGAHRIGDQNRHCGGLGQLVEGSPNVIVGESSGGVVTRDSKPDHGSNDRNGSTAVSDDVRALDIDPNPATVHIQAQADVLRAAATAHVPFCEVCERARAGNPP